MNDDLIGRLSTWLAATDIGLLELRGPGVHLCLRNDGTRVEVVPPGSAAPAIAATVPVKATSVGIHLRSHPLHEAALAEPGSRVVCGEVISLLQVGALLLPVIAPQDGVVASHAVAHGTVVGYGARLADLLPSQPMPPA